MSGKGKQGGGSGQGARPPAAEDNPQIISGWEHSLYAHRNVDRYAYLGKDETTGEPEWLDWGSKRANAEATQKDGKKYNMGEARENVEEAWALRLVEVMPATLDLWRVIGDEASVAAYAATHAPPASATATAAGDWSAMYCQLSPNNAAGTLGYRWDKGYAVARLVRVSLPLAPCGAVALIVDDMGQGAEVGAGPETEARGQRHGLMAASDVPGGFKAALIKSRLGIPQDERLLPSLGRRTPPAVLVCRESEGEWEVAVPHELLPVLARSTAWGEHRVTEFRPRAGVTAETRSCTASGEGRWRRWRDGDSVVTAGVAAETEADTSTPAWLTDALVGRCELDGLPRDT